MLAQVGVDLWVGFMVIDRGYGVDVDLERFYEGSRFNLISRTCQTPPNTDAKAGPCFANKGTTCMDAVSVTVSNHAMIQILDMGAYDQSSHGGFQVDDEMNKSIYYSTIISCLYRSLTSSL